MSHSAEVSHSGNTSPRSGRGSEPQSERSVTAAILSALMGRTDLRIWRQNTGAATDQNGRLVRFGRPGAADLTGILSDGRRLEIEVKSAHGRQSVAQASFQRIIENYGGVYILARSVTDVMRGLAIATAPPAKRRIVDADTPEIEA